MCPPGARTVTGEEQHNQVWAAQPGLSNTTRSEQHNQVWAAQQLHNHNLVVLLRPCCVALHQSQFWNLLIRYTKRGMYMGHSVFTVVSGGSSSTTVLQRDSATRVCMCILLKAHWCVRRHVPLVQTLCYLVYMHSCFGFRVFVIVAWIMGGYGQVARESIQSCREYLYLWVPLLGCFRPKSAIFTLPSSGIWIATIFC